MSAWAYRAVIPRLPATGSGRGRKRVHDPHASLAQRPWTYDRPAMWLARRAPWGAMALAMLAAVEVLAGCSSQGTSHVRIDVDHPAAVADLPVHVRVVGL